MKSTVIRSAVFVPLMTSTSSTTAAEARAGVACAVPAETAATRPIIVVTAAARPNDLLVLLCSFNVFPLVIVPADADLCGFYGGVRAPVPFRIRSRIPANRAGPGCVSRE